MIYSTRLEKDRLAIFLFHGVIKTSTCKIRNYTGKHLLLKSFSGILTDLKQKGSPISMDEVIACHCKRIPYPPYSFAITFDDGFYNNFSLAAPVLKKMGIPAAFYVTTNFIQSNTMSWIDRIEYYFESINLKSFKPFWRPGKVPLVTTGDKITFLNEIRQYVKNNKDVNINQFLSKFEKVLGVEAISSSQDILDRKMSWEDVKSLANDDLFTVGGHTHTHKVLSFLSDKEMYVEIEKSLKLLKENCGISAIHYSYPEGLENCYDDRTIELLKSFRIKCCLTARDGMNSIDDCLFNLKRIPITDY